ncbi:hypothetical protein BDV98DRAFT_376262 [Pterulicium gracile]|uniref:Uncharacterized protein n=1 Tax=Pterulicium gracile TaxID=1884261 RepID=A0A5C3Q5H3_9AGAR|nr:hypothetical protein BDV98DRAFT_376262 [Pterula gracilis]
MFTTIITAVQTWRTSPLSNLLPCVSPSAVLSQDAQSVAVASPLKSSTSPIITYLANRFNRCAHGSHVYVHTE